MRFALVACAALLLALPFTAHAQEGGLRGLRTVSPAVTTQGHASGHLLALMNQRLERARIPTLPYAAGMPSDVGVLSLEIGYSLFSMGTAFSATLKVYQAARLERDPGQTVTAVTWQQSITGVSPAAQLDQTVAQAVEALLQAFLADYARAQPGG